MENASKSQNASQSGMEQMMAQAMVGMGADEKKQMISTMMGRICEGVDMKDMMPMMMSKMMGDSESSGMPEMMLQSMMPHCIGVMLPSVDAEKRGDIAASIVASLVENGAVEMTEEQKTAFLKKIAGVLAEKA